MTVRNVAAAGSIARVLSGFGPQIMLEPEDKHANPGESADTAAAQEAARQAAEQQAAAEKAAAELAEAEKAAKEASEKKESDLTDKERELLREVMDKKNKMKAAEDRATQLEAELKKFDGIDLEKVKALMEAEKKREEEELERRGEFDRLKQRMAEERANERKSLEDQIADLQNQLKSRDTTIDNLTVGNSFASSKYIAEELVLTPAKAKALYSSHFEIVDGELTAFDKPKGAADRTPLVDGVGKALSFDEAFKRIIEADPDKDSLLRAKVVPGAGSKSQQTTPDTAKTQETAKAQELYGASRIAAAMRAEQKK